MKRGNLIIYDNKGSIILETGEAEGDVLPHNYPDGIPYIELPFGSAKGKRVVSVDITKTPHEVILHDIV